MKIREPRVAGSFYPLDEIELKKMIKNFFDKTESKEKNVSGIVSPHAGYVYCGKTAASVYNLIKNDYETVVILGPNHSGLGIGVATSSEVWKTPLGLVNIDEEFVNELVKKSLIMKDPKPHLYEHSIEVQLPWLQYKLKNFKFVPICINPIYFDNKTCKKIGERVKEVIKKLKRKTLIVASSDFTHHGSLYNYKPFSGSDQEILSEIKKIDMQAINYITKSMPEELIKFADRKTICGYGAIASMLHALNRKGELIDYSTSFDVSRDTSAVVGYAGIVFI